MNFFEIFFKWLKVSMIVALKRLQEWVDKWEKVEYTPKKSPLISIIGGDFAPKLGLPLENGVGIGMGV